MSRSLSRRDSFVGGSRSLTDNSALPRPTDSAPAAGGAGKKQQPSAEDNMSEEEYAANAAFEAIMAESGKARKDIGVDELHEFLGRFGLMSREALKDEMRLAASPPVDPFAQSRRAPPGSPSASTNPSSASVAKTDFVDFVATQQQQQQQQGGKGVAAARGRRASQQGDAGSGAEWIDRAVERFGTTNATKRGGGGGQPGRTAGGMINQSSSSPPGGNMARLGSDHPTVSILDPQLVARAADSGASGDGANSSAMSGDAADGVSGGNGQTSYGHDMNDSLQAIEMRLRQVLDARANTPVPGALLLDHEKTGASPGRKQPQQRAVAGRRTPSSGTRAALADTLVSPSGRPFRPHGATRLGTSPAPADGPSSPSAVLRRHQQAQLEQLLAIRRSGGSILSTTASGSNAGASQPRRAGSRLAGYAVVTPKR